MDDNNGLYVVIGILFLVLISCALIFWQLDRIKGIIGIEGEKPVEEVTYRSIKLYARDSSESLIEADYEVLDNQSRVVQAGKLKDGIIEKFEDIESNMTYYLRGFGGKYYANSQKCSLNQDSCSVHLKKIGQVSINRVKIKNGYYLGVLHIEDGMLQEPIICLEWDNMVNMQVNLSEAKIPNSLFSEYDKCYTFSENSSRLINMSGGIYTFDIRYTPITEKENRFSLEVLDSCEGRYDDGCAKDVGFLELVG